MKVDLEKRRKTTAVLALLLCLTAAVMRVVDLLLWTDVSSGLVMYGSAWIRYAAWLILAAVLYIMGRGMAVRPAALPEKCPPVGKLMIACGALAVLGGICSVGDMQENAGNFVGVVNAGVAVAAGISGGGWLILYGIKAIKGYGSKMSRPGNALGVIFPTLLFLRPLFWQFQVVPAAYPRISCTVTVLSYGTALLFLLVLAKVVLVPGMPCGKTLFSAGMCAFLGCTCLLLPQLVLEGLHGILSAAEILSGCSAAVFGVCGIVAAWHTIGEDTVE